MRSLKIAGLQKLTLLDYPGKVACTVFTYGCNFRCPYCHNASLVLGDEGSSGNIAYLELKGITDFLQKRKGIIDGIVITGGEPTIQPGILDMLRILREYEISIKIDTNGSRPEIIESIIRQGLVDYIAMDIKASAGKYKKAAGIDDIDVDSIYECISLIIKSGIDHEFRTTLVKGIHDIQDIKETAQSIKGADKYFLQQFRDSGDLIDPRGLSAFTAEEMDMYAEAARQFVRTVCIRGI